VNGDGEGSVFLMAWRTGELAGDSPPRHRLASRSLSDYFCRKLHRPTTCQHRFIAQVPGELGIHP